MKLLCVFLGGGLGSLSRYAMGLALSPLGGRWPWATCVCNLLGCVLIGVLLGWLQRRPSQVVQLLFVTGFCGGFTTFSTFSSEVVRLVREGQPTLAVGYAALSVGAGVACVIVGQWAYSAICR